MNIRILLVAFLVLLFLAAGGGAVTNDFKADSGESIITSPGDIEANSNIPPAANADIPPAANGSEARAGKATPPPDAEYYDDYEPVESEYTANTELPPMVIGGVQFYDLGKVFSGYRRCTDVIASASVFKTVYEELKASYGNPFEYRYYEKKATGNAEWRTKDSMFSLSLKLTQRGGKMCLEMYISKWKYD